MSTKKDGWREHPQKEKAVRYVIQEILEPEAGESDIEYIFNIVKNQRE